MIPPAQGLLEVPVLAQGRALTGTVDIPDGIFFPVLRDVLRAQH